MAQVLMTVFNSEYLFNQWKYRQKAKIRIVNIIMWDSMYIEVFYAVK